ncbi:MAG: DUF2334 domain-containing protein [Leptonema sp. (in: Bacteria)]|nr:DUF2334 domain-containing protein [Leptonema sp. (in: bacteria)]
MSRYILRFDDVIPAMNWPNFLQVKTVAEDLGIKSILGVILDCKDQTLYIAEPVPDFFGRIKKYLEYGDSIAQHGYTHVYDSKDGGILGINKNSEFAGHSYEV